MAVSMGRYPRTCNSGSKRSPKVPKPLCCLVESSSWKERFFNSLMFEEVSLSFFTRSFPCFPFSTQGGNTWATKCQYLGWSQFFGAEDDQPEIQWINTAEARATTAPASPRSTKVQHAVAPVYWRSSDHYIYTQPTHNLPTFGSFSGSRKLGWS